MDPTRSATLERDSTTDLSAPALRRIAVARPYFDLTSITSEGDGLVAIVPPAPPTGHEAGPVEAAQAARHLAILGSCAAALQRDDDARHHYLATKATYGRVSGTTAEPIHQSLQARATAEWVDKRTVTATTSLATTDGETLVRLHVTYTVLKPRMFERFFAPVEASDRPPASPDLTVTGPGQVVRDAGQVGPAMCAGHFPDHPAVPVALVMGRLVATAHEAVMSIRGCASGYRVEGGLVEATGLAQVGQRLTLHAQYQRRLDRLHELTAQAKADGETVGTVTVHLAEAPSTP